MTAVSEQRHSWQKAQQKRKHGGVKGPVPLVVAGALGEGLWHEQLCGGASEGWGQ